jgi:tRNA(Ile)-lysidine synthase
LAWSAVEEPTAIAVSGGADSMAALLLTLRRCKAQGLALPVAVTVDHGLRKNAAAEARQVGEWVREMGAQHQILRWEGAKPASNIQAVAREARYHLIGAWAQANGIKTVFTGHTLDDQAETFLMRLARGSGVDGLSGMAPVSPYPLRAFDELSLARPVLGFPHRRLIATLQAAKQPWIEDPSNAAMRFRRTQMRAARAALEAAGLTPERLADTAAHLRRARQAIERSVDTLLAASTFVSPWGYALFGLGGLRAAPTEIGLRALARLIAAIGGEDYSPRFEALEAVWTWVAIDQEPAGRTLGGCRLVRRPDETLLIAREESAVTTESLRLAPGESKIWDGRFRVSLNAGTFSAFEVRPLGAKGLTQAGPVVELPSVEPRLIAKTTPALWTGGRLIAAPLLRYLADETAAAQFSVAYLGLAKGKGTAKGNLL